MQEREERYWRVREAEQKLETRALTALGHFLTANAFMIVGWVTLHQRVVNDDSWALDVVVVLIAAVGYFWGIMWARLGARNWEYARRLVAELHKAGKQIPESKWAENLYQILCRVEDETQRRKPGEKQRPKFLFHSHASVLTLTPLSVSLIFVGLFVLWANGRGYMRAEHLYVPVVAATIAVCFCLYQWRVCRKQEVEAFEAVERAR